jgi:predicted RNase H-like HicB family nuclease
VERRGGGYIATSPDFEDLSAFGTSAPEAAEQFESVVRLAIRTYRSSGRILPVPKKGHEHSGRLRSIVAVLREAGGLRSGAEY